MAAEVYHRIYTHAPASPFDTTGAKIVELEEHDARLLLPDAIREALDGLLKQITKSGTQEGYVICRFASDADAFACVVVCYPDLVKDAEGRDGVLTHARVVRVDPQEAWFDVTELVDAVENFPLDQICGAPELQRLTDYRNLVSGESPVILRSVDTAALQDIPPQFFTDFLTASLATVGVRKRTQFLVSHPGNSLVAQLARASCALPLWLQRQSSWGVEVGEGTPVDAVFSTTAGKVPAAAGGDKLVSYAKRYVEFLGKAPEQLHSILRNPELRTAADFGNAVDRAVVGAPLAAAVGKGEMATRNRNKQTVSAPAPIPTPADDGDGGDALDPKIVREINRQVRSVEKELRIYIDQRLADSEARLRTAAKQQSVRSWMPSPRAWARVGVGAVVIAIGLIVVTFLRKDPAPIGQMQQTTTVVSTTTAPDTVQSGFPWSMTPEPEVKTDDQIFAEAVTTAGDQWATAFETLTKNEPDAVSRFLKKVAGHRRVNRTDAGLLRGFASRIENEEILPAADFGTLRGLLIKYINKLVVANEALSANQGYVDMAPIPATLTKLAEARTEAEKSNLEAEVILRWMEKPYR